jgi:DNA-binding GntR family transcriptional regulator
MSQPAAATAAEITAILGPIDEVVLADILRTGASAAEVQEAFMRLEADDAVGPTARRGASARVMEVMAILEAAEAGSAEDREPPAP